MRSVTDLPVTSYSAVLWLEEEMNSSEQSTAPAKYITCVIRSEMPKLKEVRLEIRCLLRAHPLGIKWTEGGYSSVFWGDSLVGK